MTALFEQDIKTADRKSSKGNQLKFERDGIWYKADNMGYEGLSEYVVAKLLSYSTLRDSEFVNYETEILTYNGNEYLGCKSRDFSDGWQVITLERLFQQTYGYGLNQMIYSTVDHKERLRLLVTQVERMTGLRDFGTYMSKILTIDAVFLNEDRHTHNLAVLTNQKKEFRLCPIFDHGAALLSDIRLDYPLNQDPIVLIDRVKAATFCDSFDEQLDLAEELYGENLHFSFGYSEVDRIISAAECYDSEIRKRVTDVVMQRRRKYEYLIK